MAPEIVEENAYSVTVSIENALEEVNLAEEKHLKRGELHLLQVFWFTGINSFYLALQLHRMGTRY
jgi:hypothetical protein